MKSFLGINDHLDYTWMRVHFLIQYIYRPLYSNVYYIYNIYVCLV